MYYTDIGRHTWSGADNKDMIKRYDRHIVKRDNITGTCNPDTYIQTHYGYIIQTHHYAKTQCATEIHNPDSHTGTQFWYIYNHIIQT